MRAFNLPQSVSASSPHINDPPIFLQPWFLRSLVGDDLVIAEYQSGGVEAFWPMQLRKAATFQILQSPDLVPYTGPWFNYPEDMGSSKRAREFRKGVSALLKGFPPHHALFGRMSPAVGDFLTLHWEGATVKPRITYRIQADKTLEEINKRMKSSNQRNINKAKSLRLVEESDTSTLWHLSQKTFGRQDLEPHFDGEQLSRVFSACAERGVSRLLSARDEEGNPHSAILFVRDEHFVYYYLGGSDPVFRNSEAFSALIWEGIKWSRKLGLGFDFEGSMHEPIARFFRSWGADREVYYEIERFNSRWAKLLFTLKKAVRK